MEFEWDRTKAERNFRKHGIGFDEAISVFADPFELTVYDPDHSVMEGRFVGIGLSSLGRLLVVGYTERESKIRLIFARRATGPESMDYEEV
jgi:uncharacterized DUF497 family protein